MFNDTKSNQPFCLSNQWENFTSLEDWRQEQEDLDVDTDDDYENSEPSIIMPHELCRLGHVSFNCSILSCHKRVIECPPKVFNCPDNSTVIEGVHPNYVVHCNETLLQCKSEPYCPIVKRPCNPGEKCLTALYECEDDRPNNCNFFGYECTDGCWARVSLLSHFREDYWTFLVD